MYSFDVDNCSGEDDDNNDTGDGESSGFRVIEGVDESSLSGRNSFDFDVDTDDESGQIVGNDSFQYNKEVLRGGRYIAREAMTFEIEDVGAHTDVNGVGMPEISENLNVSPVDYSKFEANYGNFSTSTLLGADETQKRKLSEIMEKIASIEAKVTSFLTNIASEWNDIKLTVSQMLSQETKDVQQEQERFSDGKYLILLNLKSDMEKM